MKYWDTWKTLEDLLYLLSKSTDDTDPWSIEVSDTKLHSLLGKWLFWFIFTTTDLELSVTSVLLGLVCKTSETTPEYCLDEFTWWSDATVVPSSKLTIWVFFFFFFFSFFFESVEIKILCFCSLSSKHEIKITFGSWGYY